jgi:hypothetical protein
MKSFDWRKWTVIVLVGLTAGWMLFDGTRALVAGDYTTPSSGEYAGQLGPWSNLVQEAGIDPRSTLMKSLFVMHGAAALVIVVCYMKDLPWARPALMAVCVLGLWFLPIGTVFNLIALILLFLTRR